MYRMKTTLAGLCTALALAGCARQAPPPASSDVPTVVATTPTALGMSAFPTQPSLAEPTTEAREDVTFTVQRGEVVSQLSLNGRVSLVEQSLAFSEGGIVAQVFVEPGMTVEKGQLLAELDSEDLETQLRQTQAEYEQSNAAVQQAGAAGQLEVERAQLALEAAQVQLEEVRQPARPDEIAQARSEVQQAEANLATVRNDASAAKNLAYEEMNTASVELQGAQVHYQEALQTYEKKPNDKKIRDAFEVAREELRLAEEKVNKARIAFDTARGNEVAAVANAEASVMAARATLEELLAGPDRFDIAEAERAVRDAQIGVQEARLKTQADPDLTRQAKLALSQIENIRQQIERRRLYAPLTASVLAVEVGPGMTATSASPVIILASADQRQIVAELPREDGQATSNTTLVVGQEVELVFPRYPGQTFKGTIAKVPGRTLGENDLGGGSGSYAVSYDPGAVQLDVGDLAEVQALVGKANDTLWLPPEAIRTNRERPYVLVRDSSGDRRVEVLIGLASPERVEILRGLNEGDVVVAGPAATP